MKLIRENAGGIAVEGFVNVVLPFAVYSYVKPKGGDVNGLLASMVPPLGWSVAEFIRRRRVDAVAIFIVAGIALSLVAFIGGGSVRFLQLRENLVTGLIALVFLFSAAIGKPLIYQLARAGMRRSSAAKAESFEKQQHNAHFRHSMTIMTLVWGCALLVQTAVACLLVFVLPIGAYLIVSPIFGYGTIGVLALWTYGYVERQKRIGAARRAAAESAGQVL